MAIEYLEKNEYAKAFELFKQAVDESRNIQSLTNLAWIYYHEESDPEEALKLIEEVVALKPASYLPYNLLGEIYIEMKMWQPALETLLESVKIKPSEEAYNNLGVVYFHLRRYQEAADYFLLCSKPSNYALYSHIKCLVELGNKEEAKSKLETFSEEDDEFVGEVEIAELYLEVDNYKESVQWFEKGWEIYWKTTDWVSRYIYALIRLEQLDRARELLNDVIQQKDAEIIEESEEPCSQEWTESEKEEYIRGLTNDKRVYENLYERVLSGYVPPMKFDTSVCSSCYLFGCKRHDYDEYND